jgi:acyl-CoA thioesterase-1
MGMKLVMLFVSGQSLFVGIACLLAATIGRLWCQRLILHKGLRIAAVIGVAGIVGSATPLPMWLYGVWGVSFLGSHLALDAQQCSPAVRYGFVVGCVLLSGVVVVWELQYWVLPSISATQDETVYVIGDSVSSGLDEGERPWPAVLSDSSTLHIVNLARSGSTVETAYAQLSRITTGPALVLVEIGGNDFFGETKAQIFRIHLDRLLSELQAHHHRIVMFELPLLPFYNQFGRAQRQLARQYDVVLIPKRILSDIFGMRQGTTDGIHLSQRGHTALAERIEALLAIPHPTAVMEN